MQGILHGTHYTASYEDKTNLKWSGDRNIDEQVLYRQGPTDLLDLVPVLVLLHEEHVWDVLRLTRFNDVGKLRGIL